VYPVYSRRSRGISLGINLFPDRKLCSFDCPYCEVFPFLTDQAFSLDTLERGLRCYVGSRGPDDPPIRDFCISGNGEPTLSPLFPQALDLAARARDELAPDASLVVITNGSTLLDPALFDLLRRAALGPEALDIWLKVDAGTEGWYRLMDRCDLSFDALTDAYRRFASQAPFTVQTMLCSINGNGPGAEEEAAYNALAVDLVRIGARAAVAAGANAASRAHARARGPRRFQLYGKARPAPEDPFAGPLPTVYLEARAASLSSALSACGFAAEPGPLSALPPFAAAPPAAPPVEVFP
jgi:histidinol dehydrogenase